MMTSRPWPISAASRSTIGRERLLHTRIREAERIARPPAASAGSVRACRSPNKTSPTRANVVGIAREPAAVCRLPGACTAMPREIDPPMRRPDAVKAAKARRHAHRAAGIGAEREIAGPGGHGRGRSARRAAGHAAGRRRVHRRAVMRVLAQDAERDFVGDGLADHRGAGIEQGLHHPCMTRRALERQRGQSGLPPPVGTPATSIRSLTAKAEAGERPAAAPGTCVRGPGTKASVEVMRPSGPASAPQARRRTRPWYRDAAD